MADLTEGILMDSVARSTIQAARVTVLMVEHSSRGMMQPQSTDKLATTQRRSKLPLIAYLFRSV
jgi:hypothetical protein